MGKAQNRSVHTPDLDAIVADKRRQKAREPKRCFRCGATALYQDYTGKRGACREHKQELTRGEA